MFDDILTVSEEEEITIPVEEDEEEIVLYDASEDNPIDEAMFEEAMKEVEDFFDNIANG